MDGLQLIRLVGRAKLLEVKHVEKTAKLITATIVSNDKSTYYTPSIDLEEMTCACGCMNNGINDDVCKHVVSALLACQSDYLIVELIKKREEKKQCQNIDT
jgi:hypothetical protein